MPNGHGGMPRFGSALFLLVFLILTYTAFLKTALPWVAWCGYGLAAAFGWRFAYGLHMRKVTEYDGAYSSDEALTRAFLKYIVGSIAYAIAAMAVWYFVTTAVTKNIN